MSDKKPSRKSNAARDESYLCASDDNICLSSTKKKRYGQKVQDSCFKNPKYKNFESNSLIEVKCSIFKKTLNFKKAGVSVLSAHLLRKLYL